MHTSSHYLAFTADNALQHIQCAITIDFHESSFDLVFLFSDSQHSQKSALCGIGGFKTFGEIKRISFLCLFSKSLHSGSQVKSVMRRVVGKYLLLILYVITNDPTSPAIVH